MPHYKRTTIMLAYKIRMLDKGGHRQAVIARKVGVHQTTVSHILRGATALAAQHRIADRMAYFGLLNNGGTYRTKVMSWKGMELKTDQLSVHSKPLHHDDPLAILIGRERFGKQGTLYDDVPQRIDKPVHEVIVSNPETWDEFVHRNGGSEAMATLARADGDSVLAREGSLVSSYAVRDLRCDWGYPYRSTVAEREYVAALSIQRRRQRARLGREFLLALETGHIKRPVLSAENESTVRKQTT